MVLTRDAFPLLFYLRIHSGEGSLSGEDGVSLPLDEGLLLHKGDVLRFMSLLQLRALGCPLLESLILLPQRGVEQLDLLGLLLYRGPLGVALLDGSGQLLLPRTILRPQIRHQGVGLSQPRDQIGVPLLEPLHLGVLSG